MHHAGLIDALALIAGLALLVGAGDALVRGAVALSLRVGIPALIISATVVAIGTSLPEMLVSIKAALEGAPGIVLGNVVGSNIANVLLVLGLPALMVPIGSAAPEARRNLWIMLAVTALFTVLILDRTVTWWGGAVLVGAAVLTVLDSLRDAAAARRGEKYRAIDKLMEIEDVAPDIAGWKIALLIAAGVIGLPVGADLLVNGARSIARDFGVSESAIGLTVVAVGTSLPELATTVVAAMRKHADVAIGNVVGSNIFNATAIPGVAALTTTLAVPPEIAQRDVWAMIGASILLTPYVLLCRRIDRISGGAFLALYIGYIVYSLAG